MESAKELERIIYEYQENAKNGFLFDQQIGDQIAEQARRKPNPTAWDKFLSKGGADTARFNMVCDFRDQVIAYQKKHNISSVLWCGVNWQGEVIRYPHHAFDLEIMPQDAAILTRWKDSTISKFVDFIGRHNLESQLIIESPHDDEPDTPATFLDIYSHAKKYQTAWLSGEKEKPVYLVKESSNPGNFDLAGICYHLTEYRLSLSDLDECFGDVTTFAVKIRRYD